MATATATTIPTMLLASITYFASQIARLQTTITQLQSEHDAAETFRLSTRSADYSNERKIAVIQLGKGIKKQPDLVVLQLEQTAEGCDWLINRWKNLALAFVEDRDADWDATDREMALDLIGVPLDLRRRCPLLGPESSEGISQRMMIAHHQIERLQFRKSSDGLSNRAEREQDAEVAGTLRTPDANQKRIAREIATAERSLRFAIKELKQHQKESEKAPETVEASVEPQDVPNAKPTEPTKAEILDELDAIDAVYESDPEMVEDDLAQMRTGLVEVLQDGIFPTLLADLHR